MNNGNIYKPLHERPAAESKWSKAKVVDRKEKFASLNRWVTERGGWIVSIPGEREVTIECLRDSTVPDELRKEGYAVIPAGTGERILPHAVRQEFVQGANGLEPLTEGSTRPVTTVVTGAGIASVLRYSFTLP